VLRHVKIVCLTPASFPSMSMTIHKWSTLERQLYESQTPVACTMNINDGSRVVSEWCHNLERHPNIVTDNYNRLRLGLGPRPSPRPQHISSTGVTYDHYLQSYYVYSTSHSLRYQSANYEGNKFYRVDTWTCSRSLSFLLDVWAQNSHLKGLSC